jgi:SAM-dependent methyltransferase
LEERKVDFAPAKPDPALLAYQSCAGYYDLLTADYDHEGWLSTIEQLALRHGLRGRRVLDVACGTGKSAAPLLRRGYELSACDLAPAMVRRAQMRLGSRADVFVSDMRSLPTERTYALLTCLDDAVNYLVMEDDLAVAMRSFASVLEPGGLAIFDLNTSRTYAEHFQSGCEYIVAGGKLRWRGYGQAPDGTYTAVVEPIRASGGRGQPSVHVQRHHPPEAVQRACATAGLDVITIHGQSSGGVLHDGFDEHLHTKLLYVVVRPRAREEVDLGHQAVGAP